MLAGGEVKQDFRLPLPEMSVMIVRRNRQIGGRQLGVDDEMMVSRPRHRYASRCHAHRPESELDNEG